MFFHIHKEEAREEVQRRSPAGHCVMVDDTLRVLTPLETASGERVTAVFPRQREFAHVPVILASNPPDVTAERTSDLLKYDQPGLTEGQRSIASMTKVTR